MLKLIINQILDESLSPGKLYQPINDWGRLFQEITEKKGVRELAEHKKRTLLPHGLAIDPYSAGTCLNDIIRSTQYTRGLYAAIKDLQEIIKNRPVHIVYGGCGPYAPFVMAMATQFSPEQVQFTVIDIHKESLEAVKSIAEELGFRDYFRKYVQEDAVTYQVEDDLPVDIGLAECLNKGLIKEPQLGISVNLVNQMEDHGIMIPERIKIDAYMINPRTEFSYIEKEENGKVTIHRAEAAKHRVHIAHLLDVSKPVIKELVKITSGNLLHNYDVEIGKFKIPDREPEKNTLMYTTLINTYGSFWIDEYQSGLTQPHLEHEKPVIPPSGEIHFVYKMCDMPGFTYSFG